MKILVFCPYYPPHIGGLESHADEFNKYFSQKSVDIVVFTPRLPQDGPEKEMKYEKVRIIRFPAFEIISNYPLPKIWNVKFWKLWKEIWNENFDLVISRTRFFNTSLLALFYAKIKHVKWVHIEHGSDFVKLNSPVKSFIARLYDYIFGKLVLKFSDVNIANSKASASFCKKLYPQKSCEVVYRGVEIEKIEKIVPNFDLRNKYADKIIITFLGRLIDGKGVADLLQALKGLNNKKIICFIIGDGPQKKDLENLVKNLNIQDKTIFWGHKNFEEAMAILKISDIFVNPSYTEGLPTSVIEAALCQVAIVATNVGGTPEIAEDNRNIFLIKPRTIKSLKEKIETLVNDGELRKNMREGAYQEVKEKFNWEKSIDKYELIFENLTKKIKCAE